VEQRHVVGVLDTPDGPDLVAQLEALAARSDREADPEA